MNETSTLFLSLMILLIILVTSVTLLIFQFRTNDELQDEIKKIISMNHDLNCKIDAQRKEIQFQTNLNKTLSEGLEAFTKKSKK